MVGLFWHCQKEFPSQNKVQDLSIDELILSRNPETNRLHVQALIRPADNTPVDSVWYEAFSPEDSSLVIRASLYDNGTHGDIIPMNGWYSADIPASYIQGYLPPDRDYYFPVTVFVRDQSGTTKTSGVNYKLIKNYPISIDTVMAPDTVNASLSEPVLFQAVISDSNGISDVKYVKIRQYARNDTLNLSSFFLMDNSGSASSGDRISGDDIYSITFGTNSTNTPGKRTMQIVAEDQGNHTDTTTVDFYIIK